MFLHEAIRQARIEAGLSQKRLAELAGIQRRQLATLESGGNVTINTIRKVLGQLPNLPAFTIEGFAATAAPPPPPAAPPPRPLADELFAEAMNILSTALVRLNETLREGRFPTVEEQDLFREANRVLAESLEVRKKDLEEGERAFQEEVGEEEA